MEFAEVRPYQFGDDIRNIDWNVSARYDETFIKVFEEEREQTVMLAVDISGSEDFASVGQYKREMAAEICAVVAFSAIQNNDKVGLLLFSDQVELFVPPKKGKKHVLRLIRYLFAHQKKSNGTNIKVALDHLVRVLHRRSIVMMLSDFMDSNFETSLRAIARRHDTIAVHMVDPVEMDLPDVGLLEVTDAETGHQILVDTGSEDVRNLYVSQAIERERTVEMMFRRLRIDRVPIHTDEGYVDPLIRFFRRRNKLG